MLNGMEAPTDEQQKMDNDVLKATAHYIVNTVYNGTSYDDFSILPEMIKAYIELRRELTCNYAYGTDEFVNLVSERLKARSALRSRNQL